MKYSKRTIQTATIGQLEDMLAELQQLDSSRSVELRHQVERQLERLNA